MDNYEDHENWFSFKEEVQREMLNSFNKAMSIPGRKPKGGRMYTLHVISKQEIKNFYVSWLKYGFVRNEKQAEKLKSRILYNTMVILNTTYLYGHTSLSPKEDLEDAGVNFSRWESFEGSFFFSHENSWLISDYAQKTLEKFGFELFLEKNPDRYIFIITKIFDIVHMRSDLAAVFIEGGSSTFVELSNLTKYERQYYNDCKK